MQLKEAEKIANDLLAELTPYCVAIEIAGAIRRQDPEMSSIEIVTIPRLEMQPTGQKQLDGGDETTEHHLLFEWLDANHTIVMGGMPRNDWCILQLEDGTKVDIITAEIATWGYSFMVRTGPGEFISPIVKQLRSIGLTPRGTGLQDVAGNRVSTPSEMAIFKLIDMGYVEPSERKGAQ